MLEHTFLVWTNVYQFFTMIRLWRAVCRLGGYDKVCFVFPWTYVFKWSYQFHMHYALIWITIVFCLVKLILLEQLSMPRVAWIDGCISSSLDIKKYSHSIGNESNSNMLEYILVIIFSGCNLLQDLFWKILWPSLLYASLNI